MRHLEYIHDNLSVSIAPSIYGLPSIFDKDILLYCISLLMTEINAGRTPSRTLRISCHDLLKSINRTINGKNYILLKQALDRLRGVSIKTNIKTNKRTQINAFGLLESYEVIESHRIKNRMIRLEITLSKWLYNAILGKEVLTISHDYFQLRKPIERRLYEIARKFCGHSKQWKIGLEKLMDKVGSTDTLRKFRLRLKEIAQANNLPHYSFFVDPTDMVFFHCKKPSSVSEVVPLSIQDGNHSIINKIRTKTYENARNLVHQSRTGWDFNAIIEQFCDFIRIKQDAGEKVNTINGSFMGFVKHKIKSRP